MFLLLHSHAYWKLFTVQGLRGDTETSIAGPALVGLLLAGLSPAQVKQSMQGAAATTDQSNVVKHAGAKLGRHDGLFRKLGHSGKSLTENVFFSLVPDLECV